MSGLLKFITCGSVDDGKSTLIGHILYDSKLLYADQEKALELDSKVGSRGGAIDYSLLLDGLMAEREQGITIDVAYRYFTTDKRSFIVADTPGHEEYTRNMAVGASFADLAVILIDAKQGVLVQTRRHARICALMGINYFVFAVNKMDLVAELRVRVAADFRTVAEAKRLSGLLTETQTGHRLRVSVALSKFVRVRVGFDRALVVLDRAKRTILDVICPHIGGFAAIGTFVHVRQTVPCNADVVRSISFRRKQNALGYAALIALIASSIPHNFLRHRKILLLISGCSVQKKRVKAS